ncbi:hypothetical protein WMY93_017291 [Mugilogobius chulae]|uniref:Uncharacterized protein n=1 Tax=Mugilogobius chulae TaxID=88201 RepID=A0AAW0NZY7_9GOBI
MTQTLHGLGSEVSITMGLGSEVRHYMGLGSEVRHYMGLGSEVRHYMGLGSEVRHYMGLGSEVRHYMGLGSEVRHYTGLGSESGITWAWGQRLKETLGHKWPKAGTQRLTLPGQQIYQVLLQRPDTFLLTLLPGSGQGLDIIIGVKNHHCLSLLPPPSLLLMLWLCPDHPGPGHHHHKCK